MTDASKADREPDNATDGNVDHRIANTVMRLLAQRSAPKNIGAQDDLREAGLTSMDMLNLVLAIEGEFDLTIPESGITPANFRTIAAISTLVRSLMPQKHP
jgi:acyl carrier protein